MLDSGPGSFFITASQLADSPSSRHGVSLFSQESLRFYACEIIQEAGILLRFPQVVMATAQVLLHRFFCKRSFRDFDARIIAASCFWLSTKLEEEGHWNRGEKPSRLVDVLNVFERIRVRREGGVALAPDYNGFKKRKEELLRLETQILVELGFVCHVEHPHKFLLSYLNCLDASPKLVQEAWNLVNDSLRTSLCVRFPSNVVACGVIYAAARRLGVPLPESPPWWLLFDVTLEQILEVCHAFADLYRKSKAHYVEVRDCALSTPPSAVQVHKTSPVYRKSAETVESVPDRMSSVQRYQEIRRPENAVDSSPLKEKSVEAVDPVSDSMMSVQPCQEVRRSEDAVEGVENVSVISTISASKLIKFCVTNRPGAPISNGALLGGILMAHQKFQSKGFQLSREFLCVGEDEHERDSEDTRRKSDDNVIVTHELRKVSRRRECRDLEHIRREGWRGTEHKRRREDEISFHRRAEDRCSSSLFCRMREGAHSKPSCPVI